MFQYYTMTQCRPAPTFHFARAKFFSICAHTFSLMFLSEAAPPEILRRRMETEEGQLRSLEVTVITHCSYEKQGFCRHLIFSDGFSKCSNKQVYILCIRCKGQHISPVTVFCLLLRVLFSWGWKIVFLTEVTFTLHSYESVIDLFQ